MTDREKIIETINGVQVYGIMRNAFGGDLPVTNEMVADTLIAAGIGDVQSLVDGTCVLYVKDKGIMRLYNEQDINKMIHRAEVAESELERYKRALHSACINLIKDEEDNVNMELLAHVVCTKFLRKAEKEIEEERK